MKKILVGYLTTVFLVFAFCLIAQADLRDTPSGDILVSAEGGRNSVNITNLIADFGSTRPVRLIFDAGVWIFSNNVTFTSNFTVEIREGASWNVLTNITVDLTTADFDAPFGLPWTGDGVVTGNAAFLWNKIEWGPENDAGGTKDPGDGRINVYLDLHFLNTTNWAITTFVARVAQNLTINISTNDNAQDIINLMTNIGFVDTGAKLTFQWEDGDHFYAVPLDFFGNLGGAGQVCLLGNTNDPTLCRVNFTNKTSGFVVMDNGTINLIDGFTVNGTSTNVSTDVGVFSRNSSSLNVGSNMIVTNFHFGYGASQAGELVCSGGKVHDCFLGVTASINGTIVGDNMFIGTNNVGVQSGGSSFVRITGSTITNNALGMNALFFGVMRADGTITNGNTIASVPVTNVTGTTQGFISRIP